MKEYKRQYRQLDDETKQKISNSSRNRPKSDQHNKRKGDSRSKGLVTGRDL